MKKISLLKLYLIFVKIGAILLGGGYVILPILKDELVTKRKLVTNSELIDYFALSQSLPGIIAANISMFIGNKLRGLKGSVTAMFGIITIPFLCIILLAEGLCKITRSQLVTEVFWGVGVAVIALIILTSREMLQNTRKDLFFYVIFTLSLITLLAFKLSPVNTILIFTVLSILIKLWERKNDIR